MTIANTNFASKTTASDLQEMVTFVSQNYLDELRAEKESGPRALAILGRRLSSLRADESRLLNRLYPGVNVDDLNSKMAGYQSTVKDINAFDPADIDITTPTPEILTYYSNLRVNVRALYDLLKNKQTEINEVLSETKILQSQINFINSKLASNDAPTDTDLETDRVLRRQATEVMMLWEIQQQYIANASDVNDTPGFSQNPKVVNHLNSLSDRFVALAELHPEISLDLGNPGSPVNVKSIQSRLEILKGATIS
jgi:hypothetical protein